MWFSGSTPHHSKHRSQTFRLHPAGVLEPGVTLAALDSLDAAIQNQNGRRSSSTCRLPVGTRHDWETFDTMASRAQRAHPVNSTHPFSSWYVRSLIVSDPTDLLRVRAANLHADKTCFRLHRARACSSPSSRADRLPAVGRTPRIRH